MASNSQFGTYFYLTSSLINTIDIESNSGSTDVGRFWVFRNATGSYLSITWGFCNSASSNVIPIPPSNSLTMMYVNNVGDYGCNAYAVF
jgi:hypothetical protein